MAETKGKECVLFQHRQHSSVQAIIKPLLKTDNSNRIRDNSIADTLAAFEAKIWT